MTPIDWDKTALLSEVEYSKALKSIPVEYPGFIHMHNQYVPWNGDFNRAVGVKIADLESFEEIVRQVESIHRKLRLSGMFEEFSYLGIGLVCISFFP